MAMKTLDGLEVSGRRVLVRVDFNVPLATGRQGSRVVADDTRIVSALPTIEELRSKGARLILVSHLGRPKGKPDPELSLAPVAQRLGELTGAKVTLAPEVVGGRAHARAERRHAGDLQLLEKVSIEGGETSNHPQHA
ncbi:MAG: phosphoglycerate kinase, partial [Solirubrobacteraceae bacterium]